MALGEEFGVAVAGDETLGVGGGVASGAALPVGIGVAAVSAKAALLPIEKTNNVATAVVAIFGQTRIIRSSPPGATVLKEYAKVIPMGSIGYP